MLGISISAAKTSAFVLLADFMALREEQSIKILPLLYHGRAPQHSLASKRPSLAWLAGIARLASRAPELRNIASLGRHLRTCKSHMSFRYMEDCINYVESYSRIQVQRAVYRRCWSCAGVAV